MPKFMIDDKEVSRDELMQHLEAVPKSRLDTQITAKREAEAALTEAQGKLADLPKITKRLAELEGEVVTHRTAAELSALGVTDSRAQRSLRAIYSAEIDGVEKPPTLADWIKGDGAANPLVKAALGATPGNGAGKADPVKEGVTTQRNGGADPNGGGQGSGGVRMTGAQLAAYLNSPAFAARIVGKSGAERMAEIDKVQAEQATLPETMIP